MKPIFDVDYVLLFLYLFLSQFAYGLLAHFWLPYRSPADSSSFWACKCRRTHSQPCSHLRAQWRRRQKHVIHMTSAVSMSCYRKRQRVCRSGRLPISAGSQTGACVYFMVTIYARLTLVFLCRYYSIGLRLYNNNRTAEACPFFGNLRAPLHGVCASVGRLVLCASLQALRHDSHVQGAEPRLCGATRERAYLQ